MTDKPHTLPAAESNPDNKLYTIIVFSENLAGVLNLVTNVFTRRQLNIESLNVSP